MVKVSKNDLVEIDGVTKTVGEWCEEYERPITTVRRRVYGKGMSVANAIKVNKTIMVRNQGLVEYTIDGMTKTLLEWCNDYEVPLKTVSERLSYGWDIKDAITRPIRDIEAKYIITAMHDGEEKSLTINEWAVILNCCQTTILGRIAKNGWSPEKAVTTPVKPRSRMISAMHDGELKTLNMDSWSKLTGVPLRMIQKRVSRDGMTYEDAVTTPLAQYWGKKITAEHDGKIKTLHVREWAELLGCNSATIYDRINKLGWSPEKAVTTPVKRMPERSQ